MTQVLGVVSPFAAAFSVPLNVDEFDGGFATDPEIGADRTWWLFIAYTLFTILMTSVSLLAMVWLFNKRWRVSQ